MLVFFIKFTQGTLFYFSQPHVYAQMKYLHLNVLVSVHCYPNPKRLVAKQLIKPWNYDQGSIFTLLQDKLFGNSMRRNYCTLHCNLASIRDPLPTSNLSLPKCIYGALVCHLLRRACACVVLLWQLIPPYLGIPPIFT